MELTRKQLYDLYFKIGYGYVLKNYSKSFLDRVKSKIKVVYVTPEKGHVEIVCAYTGNDFKLKINLKKNTIQHVGVYGLNKGYDNEKLIRDNVANINP